MKANICLVFHGVGVVDRTYTVLSTEIYELIDDPLRSEIEAVDSLRPNDVLVVCTNRSTRTCFWGELLSTAARARGADGAVLDGYTRDVRQITDMKLPTFATERKTGDIVFGDIDGIVVIPKELEKEVIPLALEKVGKEDKLREELPEGATLAEAYAKHKVL